MKPPRPALLPLLLASVVALAALVFTLRIHISSSASTQVSAFRSQVSPSSSPTPVSACRAVGLRPRYRSQVSPSPPPSASTQVSAFSSQVSPPPPTVADEDALLRLLDDTNRAANDVDRRERLTAICVRWAAFNPPAAIALALESGLDPLEGALVPNLAQQWATQDFASAQAWAARLGPGELRDEVYSRLAYEMALADPAAAAHLLSQLRPAGSAREEATLTVVHAWAQRDLAAASSWVHTFAAGPLRKRAIAELATAPR